MTVIRASALTGYMDLVRDLGGDPEPLLAAQGIALETSLPDNAFIPYLGLARLLEASAAGLGCPDFALRLAARQGIDLLGGIAVIACNSRNLHEAVQDVARFMPVHSPAIQLQWQPALTADCVRLGFNLSDPGLARFQQVYEQTLGNALQILRLLAGTEISPSLVLLPHAALADEHQYRDYFGCPVLFERDCCALEVGENLLEYSITNADPLAKRLASRYLEQQFVSGTEPLSVRVAQLVRQLLPTGKYQVAVVAQQLHLHPRTLQRRLADEQLRFDEVLDCVRSELAAEYLRESALTLGQITGLLGYAEQSTFNRSCRRWFGETPRAFRNRTWQK